MFKWLFHLWWSYCSLFPIIHFLWGPQVPYSQVFSKGTSIAKLPSLNAFSLVSNASHICQPHRCSPEMLRFALYELQRILTPPGPRTPASDGRRRPQPGTWLNEGLARGLFLNANGFLMTKGMHARGLKIYIQPKKKVCNTKEVSLFHPRLFLEGYTVKLLVSLFRNSLSTHKHE